MDIIKRANNLDIDFFHDEEQLVLLQNLVERLVSQKGPVNFFDYWQEGAVLPPRGNVTPFHRFRQYQFVEKNIDEVFDFYTDAKNLERITPKQLNFKIASQSTASIQEGTEFVYNLKIHGFPAKWKTKITEWKAPHRFVDYQVKGPYSVWYHKHLFIPIGEGTLLIDEVKFILPFYKITNFLIGWFIKMDVRKIFEHRYKFIEKYYE